MSFEDVYKIVEESSNECAFNKAEAKALYDILNTLPNKSTIVEIGIQFGRSTTVIGCVSKEKDFNFIAIDNWKEDVSSEARKHVEEILLVKHALPIDIFNCSSWEADKLLPELDNIALVHIDGDHSYSGVLMDIEMWGRRIKKGGFLCLDDYGHESLKGVWDAVGSYTSAYPDKYEFINTYGNKLGVFKKL